MNSKRAEQLNEFLKQNPEDSFLRFALALEYLNSGALEQALTYFTAIINSDPDYTGVYYHLGKLYQQMDSRESAEQTFREGLQRTLGKDPHAHRELQQALDQLMDDEEQ